MYGVILTSGWKRLTLEDVIFKTKCPFTYINVKCFPNNITNYYNLTHADFYSMSLENKVAKFILAHLIFVCKSS